MDQIEKIPEHLREGYITALADKDGIQAASSLVNDALDAWVLLPRGREGAIVRTKLEEAGHRLRDMMEGTDKAIELARRFGS